jgi:hypothetical protein
VGAFWAIQLSLLSNDLLTSHLPGGESRSEGGAGGGEGQGAPAVAGQHQVHRRAVQAEDADGGHHARLHRQAAEEPRRGVAGVPL